MFHVTNTFLLKELFENYNDFKEKRDEYIIAEVDSTNEQQLCIYNLLILNFGNSSVAYDTPNAFYRHFFIEYWNCCDEFTKRIDMIKKLRDLTVDELVNEMETISNVANNDNSPVENPLQEIIPYITTQSSTSSKGNRALAYHRAITLYRDNEVNNFLNKFKKFFLTIYGDYGIIYRKGCCCDGNLFE